MPSTGKSSLAGPGDPKLFRVCRNLFPVVVLVCLQDLARRRLVAALLCGGWLALSIGNGTTAAWAAANDGHAARQVSRDPLRPFLPRNDIFMPVPGGIAAVSSEQPHGDSLEERMHSLHGGLVVGYCLRASCSRVTHLAILQVCNNRIGGLDGSDQLVLGVVKLPIGGVPGHLMSLQGRNYAENFSLYGPYTEDLVEAAVSEDTALHTILAEGMGPVAPLQYLGLSVKAQQSRETIALQMTIVGFQRSQARLPRLEVRHFCEKPMS